MRLKLYSVCAVVVLLAVGVLGAADQYSRPTPAGTPTFTKDVAPILFKNCTSCHRPGEIAPMSLLTYEDARPYARAIREEVGEGHMPPWHAEAPHGTFLDERHLTADEKDILLRWASNGAPKGDPADMPPAPTYAEGWQLGTPDKVFEMPEAYNVPASGTLEYEHIYIPTDFKEPMWVKSIEVRPGARAVVHHVLVYYKAQPDIQRAPVLEFNSEQARTAQRAQGTQPRRDDKIPARVIATYAPGTNAQAMPAGTALRLEPGGVLELQMHYSTIGEAKADRTKVGFIFSKDPSPREVRFTAFLNGQFTLPAGAADVPVDAEVKFVQDATVFGLFPHTHLRGKKWRYVLERPDGTKQTILDVPRYDFNWQEYYMFAKPLEIPAGSRIVSTAWYDNSVTNPNNPDPKVDVRWGDQTWEEMQYSGLMFSPKVAPKIPGAPGR